MTWWQIQQKLKKWSLVVLMFPIYQHFVQKQVKFNEFTHLNYSGYMSMSLWLGTAISITSQVLGVQTFILLESVKTFWIAQPFSEAFLYCSYPSNTEYCSVVWGHNFSKKQSSQLESIQNRAIRIIYQQTRHMPYHSLLYYSNITSLQDRCSQQAKSFFISISDQSSCLHHLLPQQRDNGVAFGVQISCTVRQDK